MTDQDVTIAKALACEDHPATGDRIERGLARAASQVALRDGATLFFARLWTVLAVLAAPLFAFIARHAADATTTPPQPGEQQK